jgi:hypothetical protein
VFSPKRVDYKPVKIKGEDHRQKEKIEELKLWLKPGFYTKLVIKKNKQKN